jgi:SOS response regulatory protein OraA/RecX
MLARRELSEAQLRQRLIDRRHDATDVEDALRRLAAERALDDARVAAAMARTALHVRRLGPRRALRELRAAGIADAVASAAVDEAYAAIDASAQIEALVTRRLAGDSGPVDDKTAARVYRYLVSRGHDADLVTRALRQRRRHGEQPRGRGDE